MEDLVFFHFKIIYIKRKNIAFEPIKILLLFWNKSFVNVGPFVNDYNHMIIIDENWKRMHILRTKMNERDQQ